jgi:hypothetical protein
MTRRTSLGRVYDCKEFARAQDVPLKPALTPFIDEIGDDYGLGAGMCEEAPNSLMAKDAYMDMERTLQELGQNACVCMERNGYFTYGSNFEDVEGCHASIYGNLTSRRVACSENRKEGAVPTKFVCARRVGRICVETNVGSIPPNKV